MTCVKNLLLVLSSRSDISQIFRDFKIVGIYHLMACFTKSNYKYMYTLQEGSESNSAISLYITASHRHWTLNGDS